MALVKDSGGRETVRPDRWRPLPQQGRGPVVSKAPAPRPREVFNQAPAPVAVVPQQQPMLVQVAPQPQAQVLPVSPVPQAVVDMGFTMPKSQTILVPQAEEPVPYSRDPRTLDQALRSTWGNLENEGAAAMVKARETGREPQSTEQQRSQQMQNLADSYNAQARLGRRDAARREREASDRKEKRGALTAEEWAAYSPLQQAAAQANADLFAAVQRDFKTRGKHGSIDEEGRRTNDKLSTYQDRVEELFGEDGSLGFKGLEYAPNTIAFLDSRGIDRRALAGRSLADLLSGDTLFTKGVIDNLGQEVPEVDPFKTGQQQTQRESNIAFAQAVAKGQLQYQEKLAQQLAKGDQLLTTMTSRGTNAEAANSYGARGQANAAKLTAVRPEILGRIDMYMEGLARPDRDPAETLQVLELDLQQRGASQQEIDQVYRSMSDRVRLAMQGNGKWFPGVDYQLRSPDEVGKILGLPTLKRAEG